jgi:hypothetical protein
MCGVEFDPTKDLFLTVHERKGPSLDLCSLSCATRYLNDED